MAIFKIYVGLPDCNEIPLGELRHDAAGMMFDCLEMVSRKLESWTIDDLIRAFEHV